MIRLNWPEKHRERSQVPQAAADGCGRCALGDEPWPLVLTGDAGSGKTCAALCMLDHFGGRYFAAEDWAASIRDAAFGRLDSPVIDGSGGWPITERMLWADWDRFNLAVLDELGVRGKVSDHHFEVVKKCIDRREGKPLILISNQPLSEIARIYDDRIASRMAGGTVVELSGDRRIGS